MQNQNASKRHHIQKMTCCQMWKKVDLDINLVSGKILHDTNHFGDGQKETFFLWIHCGGGGSVVVVAVTLSSHVRIMGECSTIHSSPVLLFF